jgi:antitoxin YefM
MNVATYSHVRSNLKSVMQRVVEDHVPIAVTRQRGEAVVMVSMDDWNAIQETLYLLSSPANAKRLSDAMTRMDAGKGTERALIDP